MKPTQSKQLWMHSCACMNLESMSSDTVVLASTCCSIMAGSRAAATSRAVVAASWRLAVIVMGLQASKQAGGCHELPRRRSMPAGKVGGTHGTLLEAGPPAEAISEPMSLQTRQYARDRGGGSSFETSPNLRGANGCHWLTTGERSLA